MNQKTDNKTASVTPEVAPDEKLAHAFDGRLQIAVKTAENCEASGVAVPGIAREGWDKIASLRRQLAKREKQDSTRCIQLMRAEAQRDELLETLQSVCRLSGESWELKTMLPSYRATLKKIEGGQ